MATLKLPILKTAALGAVLAMPAVAADPSDYVKRTTEVQTGDLDLSRDDGQQELQVRIDRAVRQVCRSNVARTFGERKDVAQCEANARADAQVQAEERIAESTELRNQLARARRMATDN
jgi:UrcA family protein